MTRQVPWNKRIVETFVEEAMLTKEEELVLRTRIEGWTRLKQSQELGMSIPTIDRIISRLKLKYDQVQEKNDSLPPRAKNAKEVRKLIGK